MRPMSIADVLALHPCWDEGAIRVTARNKRLTRESYDPREVLRRLRGYVRDCDLAWLFQCYLAKHHPGRALIASSWRDARHGDYYGMVAEQRHAVATGEFPGRFSSVEAYARARCIAGLDDIARVMDMTYAEALAVTE